MRNQINNHTWIDLGLPSGTKWATCNVGASKPEEFGNYYAWGETETKDFYSWDTYKYGTYNYNTDYSKLTKYNTDELTTLEATDDAATANWGEEWRMPTKAEWQELHECCTWTWTTLNGVNGYEVKAANGNSIFLPAAGYRSSTYLTNTQNTQRDGFYWASSFDTNYPHSAFAVNTCFIYMIMGGRNRYCGQSVRPVLK